MTTMHGEAAVRPASVKDLPRVERLLTDSKLPLDGVRESLCDFIVAEANGDIVGRGDGEASDLIVFLNGAFGIARR